jgi:hypothetical protein
MIELVKPDRDLQHQPTDKVDPLLSKPRERKFCELLARPAFQSDGCPGAEQYVSIEFVNSLAEAQTHPGLSK